MSFEFEFVGARGTGHRVVERESYRSKGFGFPPQSLEEAARSMAIGAARTVAGDPTSSVSGGAAVDAAHGANQIHMVHLLRTGLTELVAGSRGNLLVTVRKKGLFRTRADQQRFVFFSGMNFGTAFLDLVRFLNANDLAAQQPYAGLANALGALGRRGGSSEFVCNAEYKL